MNGVKNNTEERSTVEGLLDRLIQLVIFWAIPLAWLLGGILYALVVFMEVVT